jgi:hypothetical protein
MTPLAPQRYGFQFTGDQETRELYEAVRDLLSHQVPNGEMAQVFKRALQLAKAELMKRKYAVTDRPGRSRGSKSARHISGNRGNTMIVEVSRQAAGELEFPDPARPSPGITSDPPPAGIVATPRVAPLPLPRRGAKKYTLTPIASAAPASVTITCAAVIPGTRASAATK